MNDNKTEVSYTPDAAGCCGCLFLLMFAFMFLTAATGG